MVETSDERERDGKKNFILKCNRGSNIKNTIMYRKGLEHYISNDEELIFHTLRTQETLFLVNSTNYD